MAASPEEVKTTLDQPEFPQAAAASAPAERSSQEVPGAAASWAALASSAAESSSSVQPSASSSHSSALAASTNTVEEEIKEIAETITFATFHPQYSYSVIGSITPAIAIERAVSLNKHSTIDQLTLEKVTGRFDRYEALKQFLANVSPDIVIKKFNLEIEEDEENLDFATAEAIANFLSQHSTIEAFSLIRSDREKSGDGCKLSIEVGALRIIAEALIGSHLKILQIDFLTNKNPDYADVLCCLPKYQHLTELGLPNGYSDNEESRLEDTLGEQVYRYISQCNPSVIANALACYAFYNDEASWFLLLTKVLIAKDPQGIYLDSFFGFQPPDDWGDSKEGDAPPAVITLLIEGYQDKLPVLAKVTWQLIVRASAIIGDVDEPTLFLFNALKKITQVSQEENFLPLLVNQMLSRQAALLEKYVVRKEHWSLLQKLMVAKFQSNETTFKFVCLLVNKFCEQGLLRDRHHEILNDFATENEDKKLKEEFIAPILAGAKVYSMRRLSEIKESQENIAIAREFAVCKYYVIDRTQEESFAETIRAFSNYYKMTKADYLSVARFYYWLAQDLLSIYPKNCPSILARAISILEENPPSEKHNDVHYRFLYLCHKSMADFFNNPGENTFDPLRSEQHYRKALQAIVNMRSREVKKCLNLLTKLRNLCLMDDSTEKMFALAMYVMQTVMKQNLTRAECELLIPQITSLHILILKRAGFGKENSLEEWIMILRVVQFACNRYLNWSDRSPHLMENFISKGLPALIAQISNTTPAPSLVKLTDILEQATLKITTLEDELRQVKSRLAAVEQSLPNGVVTASVGALSSSAATSVYASDSASLPVPAPLLLSMVSSASASSTSSGMSSSNSSIGSGAESLGSAGTTAMNQMTRESSAP